MNKKKKSAISACSNCGCYFLTRDLEQHPQSCEIEMKTLHIRPKITLVANNCAMEKRDTHLPGDAIGWVKEQTVLVNPDTLRLLGILPRSPCMLHSDSAGTQIVMAWACNEVRSLQVSVNRLPADNTVRLDVIKPVGELKTLQLHPQDEVDDRLLLADHFMHYVRVYLSSSFVSPNIPIAVKYLGKSMVFDVSESDVDRLNRLKIADDTNPYIVYSLAHDFTVSFTENFR